MTQAKSDTPLPSAEGLEREAAKWLAAIDKMPGNQIDIEGYARENPDFDAWLNATDTNRVALLRLKHVWQRTGRLSAVRRTEEAARRTSLTSPRAGLSILPSLTTTKWASIAAAALFLALVPAGLRTFTDGSPEGVYQTEVGGQETVPLVDGSKIELNSNTKLIADISEAERTITLERGEAFFEVSRDENRPFRVIAGNQVITVLGTKFSVHRRAGGVEVVVTEGRVQINDRISSRDVPLAILTAGDIASAQGGAVLVTPEVMAVVERELSWRQGRIVFEKATLTEVAQEFNRYNRIELVINDPGIADLRFSGSFKSDNIDGFVRLLTDGFGVQARREGQQILISE